ncbi:MAG: tetratricopeptide repeat protein, partial [Paracoccaceae bacterium]
MLGIAEKSARAEAPDLIKDGTEQTFLKDVIETSLVVPVIVDFWAPWCGPCKTLTPMIEAAVLAGKNRVRLVKINVDQNQQLAAQLRIQSLPTVYAFWQGKPLDGFQGVVGASDLKRFVDQLTELVAEPEDGLAAAVEAAETMLAEGAAQDAAETFAAILDEEPENADAYGGLIRAHIAMGDIQRADELATSAPAAITNHSELTTARAIIALTRQATQTGPVADLRASLVRDPADRQAMFGLATALYADGNVEEAVDTLLDLFKLDREWDDGAAKKQLMVIFDALKPQDP